MKKYFAASQEDAIELMMEPEIKNASMAPIPAAVLLIRTENIKERVPTTTDTNQPSPKIIRMYCH